MCFLTVGSIVGLWIWADYMGTWAVVCIYQNDDKPQCSLWGQMLRSSNTLAPIYDADGAFMGRQY